jgi:hypothetical protein
MVNIKTMQEEEFDFEIFLLSIGVTLIDECQETNSITEDSGQHKFYKLSRTEKSNLYFAFTIEHIDDYKEYSDFNIYKGMGNEIESLIKKRKMLDEYLCYHNSVPDSKLTTEQLLNDL